jgi:phospholipid/cholesterol/gamma-HCH transport system permease protein
MDREAPGFEVEDSGETRILKVRGDWTVWTVAAISAPLRAQAFSTRARAWTVDATALGTLDTAGAFLIQRAFGDRPFTVTGSHPSADRLLREVARHREACPPPPPRQPGLADLVARVGKGWFDLGRETLSLTEFLGRSLATLVRVILRPERLRWTSIVAVIEDAGLNAVPVVSALAFFIGVVVAYMGVDLLSQFGASIFTVELIAVSMLREFGVLIAAIILAGRSDSAFAAQIGAMKMQQEIDALQVLGLDVYEVLIVPRLIAMLVIMPILAFIAALAGLAGGLLVLAVVLELSPIQALGRIQEVIPFQHFTAGLVKAPFFAVALALIGCRQGLLVERDVTSLGRRTTAAVVQAIFLVIAMDAAFAVIFLEIGL